MLNRINEYTDEQDKSPYAEWLASLRDARARARVIMQVDRMELGLFGDSEPVGDKSTIEGYQTSKDLLARAQEEKIMARNVRATHSVHLRHPEVAAEYLNQALQEDNPGVLLMALRNIAEAQEGGIAGLAARTRLGRESMYKMLSETGNPKLSSFTRIIHGLGLNLKVQAHV